MTAEENAQLIVDCLTRMGLKAATVRYEVLAGGASGSHVYRLWWGEETAVLKATLVNTPPAVRQRAEREFTFYHTFSQHLPIRLPRLLASASDSSFGTCLLLATYQQATWHKRDYEEVAKQLAHFHASFWQKTTELAQFSWLRQPSLKTDDVEIHRAHEAWRALQQQPRLKRAFTAKTYDYLCHRLACLAAIDAIIHAFPATLCHGDCHLDNFLKDSHGRLIWLDWQEVGIGSGPEDLSFLLQRASQAGQPISAAQMLALYRAYLNDQVTAHVSRSDIEQVVNASELRTTLLHWPFYLQQAPVEQIETLLQRIEMLGAKL